MRNLAALIAGLLFGLGLTISQMINPLKVLAFLDIFGHWDPSLALVMAGAVAITLPGFALLRRRQRPLLAGAFQWPKREDINLSLVIGSALFGVGWGLAGYCPGPGMAAVALTMNDLSFHEPLIFTAAMIAGFFIWHLIDKPRGPHTQSETAPDTPPAG